ncbi:MAG: hypothetical protein GY806_01705 [Gammaproteobacteria bacterium]|nr:hypothetical protein [Gammaproteobacteria bacterium]
MKIQLSNLEKEQLKSVALPIWQNIVDASRNQDYARFSRGFSSELRAKLSEQHFRMSCQEIPLLTTIDSDFEFIDTVQREKGVTILWRLRSTDYDGEFLGILTLQSGVSGMEISGVSIN